MFHHYSITGVFAELSFALHNKNLILTIQLHLLKKAFFQKFWQNYNKCLFLKNDTLKKYMSLAKNLVGGRGVKEIFQDPPGPPAP